MRSKTYFIWMGLTLLLSCKQNGVQAIAPSLTIDQKALNFPLTPYGSTNQLTLNLHAISNADVQVTLTSSGQSASSYVLGTSGATTVPGLQSVAIQVTFAPQQPSPLPSGAQTLDAILTITSNDPQHPSTTVNLNGSAEAPQFDLCWNQPPPKCTSQGPLTIEFGSRPPRAADGGVVEVDLEDLSAVPLTISKLELDAAAQAAGYTIEETANLPITLSAQKGETDVFHIKLTPVMSGPATGNLSVVTDDPRQAGQPVQAALDATIQPFLPPVACLGIKEIDYLDGVVAAVDPSQPLSAQPSIQPPGPLDTVVVTAITSSSCSFDPQDGQNLAFQFAMVPPATSLAELAAVSGHSEEQRVQFDLPGTYSVTVKVTDSATPPLSAMATLDIPVSPQDDIEAILTWPGIHEADLDLHLIRQLSDAGTSSLVDNPQNDCFWCNCLLSVNYQDMQGEPGPSPCTNVAPDFVTYPTSLSWGATATPTTGNPLLVATQRFKPFPTENLDDVRLTGPQPGATYGLYVHYYEAYQVAADAGCETDQECTDPVYASCWQGECVPIADASLQIYVTGKNISDTLFDGGLQLTNILRNPCDLWYAGDIQWISGGHFSDGGFAPAIFTFTPGDGGVGNNSKSSVGLTCSAPSF